MKESEFLTKLIQTSSESGKESELAKHLVFSFDEIGVQAYIDRIGNVVASVGNGPISIVYNAHIDTVKVDSGDGWYHSPLSGYFDGEYVWGCGATDMKGAIASIYFAFKNFVKNKSLLKNVTLIFTGLVFEESAEGAAFERCLVESNLSPDLVVICEPSSLNLINRQRGRLELNVKIAGVSAHAAFPQNGKNSIYRAAEVITKINRYSQELRKRKNGKSGNIAITGINSCSLSKNAIPAETRLVIDRRLDINEKKEDAVKELEDLIKTGNNYCDLSITDFNFTTFTGYTLKGQNYFPAWQENDNKIISAAESAYKKIFAKKAKWEQWDFGTDGSFSRGTANIPTIGLGPGNADDSHKINEKIKIDDVKKATRFYTELPEFVL